MKKLSERSSYSISYIFVKWITLEVTHSKIVIKNVKQERRGESARRSLSGERMRRLGEQRHCVQRPLREARIPVVQPRRRPSARPSQPQTPFKGSVSSVCCGAPSRASRREPRIADGVPGRRATRRVRTAGCAAEDAEPECVNHARQTRTRANFAGGFDFEVSNMIVRAGEPVSGVLQCFFNGYQC